MAPTDEAGFFTATSVSGPLRELGKENAKVQDYQRHLKSFCQEDRGRVLVSVGPDHRPRYRFADALMQPYVILDGIAKGMMSIEMILKAKGTPSAFAPFH